MLVAAATIAGSFVDFFQSNQHLSRRIRLLFPIPPAFQRYLSIPVVWLLLPRRHSRPSAPPLRPHSDAALLAAFAFALASTSSSLPAHLVQNPACDTSSTLEHRSLCPPLTPSPALPHRPSCAPSLVCPNFISSCFYPRLFPSHLILDLSFFPPFLPSCPRHMSLLAHALVSPSAEGIVSVWTSCNVIRSHCQHPRISQDPVIFHIHHHRHVSSLSISPSIPQATPQ